MNVKGWKILSGWEGSPSYCFSLTTLFLHGTDKQGMIFLYKDKWRSHIVHTKWSTETTAVKNLLIRSVEYVEVCFTVSDANIPSHFHSQLPLPK